MADNNTLHELIRVVLGFETDKESLNNLKQTAQGIEQIKQRYEEIQSVMNKVLVRQMDLEAAADSASKKEYQALEGKLGKLVEVRDAYGRAAEEAVKSGTATKTAFGNILQVSDKLKKGLDSIGDGAKGLSSLKEKATTLRTALSSLNAEQVKLNKAIEEERATGNKASSDLMNQRKAAAAMAKALREELKLVNQQVRDINKENKSSQQNNIFFGVVKGAVVGRVVREMTDSFEGLLSVYKNILMVALQFNQELLKSRTGMAAIIMGTNDIRRGDQLVTDSADKYRISLGLARDIQAQMLAVSNKMAVTYEEMNDAAVAGMSILSSRAVPLQRQAEILGLMLSTEKALGITQQQMFMEFKQFFKGDRVKGEVLRTLELSKIIDVKKMMGLKGNDLADYLTNQMKMFVMAGGEWTSGLQGKFENFVSNAKFALASIFDDPNVMVEAQGIMNTIMSKFFISVDTARGRITMLTDEGRRVVTMFGSLASAVLKAASSLASLVANSTIFSWLTTFTALVSGLIVVVGGGLAVISMAALPIAALGASMAVATGVGAALLGGLLALSFFLKDDFFASIRDADKAVVEFNGHTIRVTPAIAGLTSELEKQGNRAEKIYTRYRELLAENADKLEENSAKHQELHKAIDELASIYPATIRSVDEHGRALTFDNEQLEKNIKLNQDASVAMYLRLKALKTEKDAQLDATRLELAMVDKYNEKGDVTQTAVGKSALALPWRQYVAVMNKLNYKGDLKETHHYLSFIADAIVGCKQGEEHQAIEKYFSDRFRDVAKEVNDYMGSSAGARLEPKYLTNKREEYRKVQKWLGNFSGTLHDLIEPEVIARYNRERDLGRHPELESIRKAVYSNTLKLIAGNVNAAGEMGRALESHAKSLSANRENLQESLNKCLVESANIDMALQGIDATLTPEARKRIEGQLTATTTGGGTPDDKKKGGKSIVEIAKEQVKLKTQNQKNEIELLTKVKEIAEVLAGADDYSKSRAINEAMDRLKATTDEKGKPLYDTATLERIRKMLTEQGVEEITNTIASCENERTYLAITILRNYAANAKREDAAELMRLISEYLGDLQTGAANTAKGAIKRVLDASKADMKAIEDLTKTLFEEMDRTDEEYAKKTNEYAQSIYTGHRRLMTEVKHSLEQSNEALEQVRTHTDMTDLLYNKNLMTGSEYAKQKVRDFANERKAIQTTIDTYRQYIAILESRREKEREMTLELNRQWREANARGERPANPAAADYDDKFTSIALASLSGGMIDEDDFNALNDNQKKVATGYTAISAEVVKLSTDTQKCSMDMIKMIDAQEQWLLAAANAFGAIDAMLSKFNQSIPKLLASIMGSTQNLLQAVSSLSKAKFTQNIGGTNTLMEAGSIGGFFKNMFSNGLTGIMQGLPGLAGAVGAGIGLFNSVVGFFKGIFEKAAKKLAEQFAKSLDANMAKYKAGTSTLALTLQNITDERNRMMRELPQKKGGTKYLNEVLPKYNEAIAQLEAEQKKIFENMDKALEQLRLPEKLRSVKTDFDNVIKTYKEYVDAGGDAAKANEFMSLSFADLRNKLQEGLDDALKDYQKSQKDEMKSWMEGAEDEMGRLISQEQKAQADIDKLRADYLKNHMERLKEIREAEEALTDFIKDKQKEIDDIRNEGLAERRKDTYQDKLVRIAAIQDEISEERKKTAEKIDQINKEDKADLLKTNNEISRIQLKLERDRAAHEEKMANLDEEKLEKIRMYEMELAYLAELIAMYHTAATAAATGVSFPGLAGGSGGGGGTSGGGGRSFNIPNPWGVYGTWQNWVDGIVPGFHFPTASSSSGINGKQLTIGSVAVNVANSAASAEDIAKVVVKTIDRHMRSV